MSFKSILSTVTDAVKSVLVTAEGDAAQILHPVETALAEAAEQVEVKEKALAADVLAAADKGLAGIKTAVPAIEDAVIAAAKQVIADALASHGL